MKYGHRQMLDVSQVQSSTGRNREAWPLRLLPELATADVVLGANPAFVASATEPVSRLGSSSINRG